MKIEKSQITINTWVATWGYNLVTGSSPIEALDRMFELLCWQSGIVRPDKDTFTIKIKKIFT